MAPRTYQFVNSPETILADSLVLSRLTLNYIIFMSAVLTNRVPRSFSLRREVWQLFVRGSVERHQGMSRTFSLGIFLVLPFPHHAEYIYRREVERTVFRLPAGLLRRRVHCALRTRWKISHYTVQPILVNTIHLTVRIYRMVYGSFYLGVGYYRIDRYIDLDKRCIQREQYFSFRKGKIYERTKILQLTFSFN